MKISKSKFINLFACYVGLPKEVYILFLGKMINCIGAFVHPLLSLILTKKIGLSASETGYFLTMAAVAQVPCILIGGKLVDTFQRKKIIVIFQSLAALIYIICGVIPPSNELAIFLIVASCFSSFVHPAYDSIVGDITNKENRKASFSLIYMGLNLGFAIGPLLGGFLFENHLSILFIGDAVTTLISVGLIGYFIKDSYKNNKEVKKTKIDSLEKVEEGSVLKVFKERPILLYYSIIMLIFQFGYSQISFAMPIQLGELFGDNGARYFGIISSLNGVFVIFLTPLVTAITRQVKITKMMSFGGLLYALAFGSCGLITRLPIFFIVCFVITLGEVCIAINSGTFITNLTPSSHRGRVNSVIPLIYGAGNALGPSIMGTMIDGIGMNRAWGIVGLVVGIGSIFMYLLKYINVQK